MSRCRRPGFWTGWQEIPADLENYALKPLYSFAGLGVVIAPTKEDIAAIPGGEASLLHFAGADAF